jgi:hypothetical protein
MESGAHSGGGGGGHRAAAPSQTSQNRNLKKKKAFLGMISKVLRDFLFSRNQPEKSADDWYIRILRNKLIEFKKKNKKTGRCD